MGKSANPTKGHETHSCTGRELPSFQSRGSKASGPRRKKIYGTSVIKESAPLIHLCRYKRKVGDGRSGGVQGSTSMGGEEAPEMTAQTEKTRCGTGLRYSLPTPAAKSSRRKKFRKTIFLERGEPRKRKGRAEVTENQVSSTSLQHPAPL